MASFTTDAIFFDGLNEFTLSSVVEYQTDTTPVINSVSPRTGTVYGGDTVTLTGLNLMFGDASVLIDGIECVVDPASTTATSLTCVTG